MSDFFRKNAFRKGRQAAVSATARKLAVIIENMVVKQIPYLPEKEYLFLDQKRKLKMVKRIRKQMTKFDIKLEDVRLPQSPHYQL